MPYSESDHSRIVSSLLASISYLSNFTNTFFSRLYPDLKLPVPHPDLSGKTAIVTGANSGIGFEIARILAGMGARVVLACRDVERARLARENIVQGLKEKNMGAQLDVDELDLARFESVHEFVERWSRRESTKVNILMNNAGAIYASLSTTTDGFESQYQINHLSPLLLTLLLLNRAFMSQDARIVNLSTGAFYSSDALTAENTNGNDVMAKHKHQQDKEYGFADTMQLYGRSKGAIVVWTIALQRRLEASEKWKGVSVHVCNPCPSDSRLWLQPSVSATDPGIRFFKFLATKVISHPCEQGVIVPVWLATAPKPADASWRGMYWDRMRWQWLPAWTLEQQRQDDLWLKWCDDIKERLVD
ncbi:short chain dehydrogenase [Ceratobasidium sp. AG-Ba]|nr:short chain dehydrogenase [Ceratobasidium sp. AG-Ba]